MNDKLTARIWRRGRGIITWEFTYIQSSNKHWWTAPGWYRSSGRGRVYRLTIDHDYPDKPIWLGYKGKKWVNTESLYEVLLVTHPHFAIASKGFKGAANRSKYRRVKSKLYLEDRVVNIIDKAFEGDVHAV